MQYSTAGLHKYEKNGKVSLNGYNWKLNTRDKLNHIEYYSNILNKYNVVIENMDIFDLVNKYNNNDTFIYLDPPYLNTDIDYNTDNSDEFQIKLLDETNKYRYRLYSNENCKALYDLKIDTYFNNHIIFERRNNQGKKDKDGNKVKSWEFLAFSENNIAKSENIQVIEKSIINLADLNYICETPTQAKEHTDFINNGGKLIVEFKLYKTKDEKKNNNSYRTVKKEIIGLIEKGYRNKPQNVKRYKLVINTEKSIANKSKVVKAIKQSSKELITTTVKETASLNIFDIAINFVNIVKNKFMDLFNSNKVVGV